jgi:hypothetical protein
VFAAKRRAAPGAECESADLLLRSALESAPDAPPRRCCHPNCAASGQTTCLGSSVLLFCDSSLLFAWPFFAMTIGARRATGVSAKKGQARPRRLASRAGLDLTVEGLASPVPASTRAPHPLQRRAHSLIADSSFGNAPSSGSPFPRSCSAIPPRWFYRSLSGSLRNPYNRLSLFPAPPPPPALFPARVVQCSWRGAGGILAGPPHWFLARLSLFCDRSRTILALMRHNFLLRGKGLTGHDL